jgi:DNA recombination protein RmuC
MTIIIVILLVVLILLTVSNLLAGLALGRRQSVDAAANVGQLESLQKNIDRLDRLVRDEMAQARAEAAQTGRQGRQELASALKGVGDSLNSQLNHITQTTMQRLDAVRDTVEKRLETMRNEIEERLKLLQADNNKNLEQMRVTVDEKLQGTLEKRLGESFKIVSERLEQVHKGLGEMQSLAAGVGDLKKVLTNIKTRGGMGEVQLVALLEDALDPAQFEAQANIKGDNRVDAVIKLPGHDANSQAPVLLPIDAKFPLEDFQRLVAAQEAGDSVVIAAAAKELEQSVENCAASICKKYIAPPLTTDFAILFLPTESLFAEVIRQTGLVDKLRQKYRITIAGPTTLWSILASLRMGFQTLAIQKRSGEVWQLLSKVKTEFNLYGEVLDKVKKKLDEAANTVDQAAVRTRAIERSLKDVQALPANTVDTPDKPLALGG